MSGRQTKRYSIIRVAPTPAAPDGTFYLLEEDLFIESAGSSPLVNFSIHPVQPFDLFERSIKGQADCGHCGLKNDFLIDISNPCIREVTKVQALNLVHVFEVKRENQPGAVQNVVNPPKEEEEVVTISSETEPTVKSETEPTVKSEIEPTVKTEKTPDCGYSPPLEAFDPSSESDIIVVNPESPRVPEITGIDLVRWNAFVENLRPHTPTIDLANSVSSHMSIESVVDLDKCQRLDHE